MSNFLKYETSPYLLQHVDNPVNWYAWNDETLALAASENKMLLISVGYAACHWCHVMAHESFENEEVARVMNEHYICVKVDREERPDVDQVYLDAAYLINGNGGWPLNALALPDGKPFFAGTYYPPDNWIRLLKYFAEIYDKEREKLVEQAENVSKGIRELEKIPLNKEAVLFDKSLLDELYINLLKRIDWEDGGTKGNMKFPMPSVWEFLLKYHYFSGNEEALQAVKMTLDNIAGGGIYDQVGGGFSRYATDTQWHVPHFEKMLYDNAQLVSLYSHAYQVLKDPEYKRIVYETVEFISRELTHPQGGFYSSLDADSEGEEGKFYVWTLKEIQDALGDDAEIFINWYGITSRGNWEEQKNIPDVNYGDKDAVKEFKLSDEELQNRLKKMNAILLSEREKRIRPATDDKILTSWNCLMITGLIDAYKAFNEPSFFVTAKSTLDFLLKNIHNEDGSVYRNYKNGKASIPAFLDDYAFFISALINFYQVSFDEAYLHTAQKMMDYVRIHFYDKSSGMFYFTDDRFSKLIARKTEITDNVIPSSNSEMAKNLLFLGMYFERKEYEMEAEQMLKNITSNALQNPGYFSNWACVMSLQIHPPFEIAIVGKKWKEKVDDFQNHFFPDALFLGGENGSLPLLDGKEISDKTMIYVCRNKTCALPVEKVEGAIRQMTR
ncbi:MAG: thioredoxin domain-containing protein [Ginsengibacter sp.]